MAVSLLKVLLHFQKLAATSQLGFDGSLSLSIQFGLGNILILSSDHIADEFVGRRYCRTVVFLHPFFDFRLKSGTRPATMELLNNNGDLARWCRW